MTHHFFHCPGVLGLCLSHKITVWDFVCWPWAQAVSTWQPYHKYQRMVFMARLTAHVSFVENVSQRRRFSPFFTSFFLLFFTDDTVRLCWCGRLFLRLFAFRKLNSFALVAAKHQWFERWQLDKSKWLQDTGKASTINNILQFDRVPFVPQCCGAVFLYVVFPWFCPSYTVYVKLPRFKDSKIRNPLPAQALILRGQTSITLQIKSI